MVVGRLLAIPVDNLFGIVAGVTGNPAILGYASRAVATDRPDIGFATIFPSTVLMKILFVQVVAALLR
jgi:putative transport protein